MTIPTMTNLHPLQPCLLCPTRMAVPGSPCCTVCEIELLGEAS